jgi:hypothetical protein
MMPTTGELPIGGKTSNREANSHKHGNSPFRDLHKGGHDLNESYKKPAANESGENHSYMHPLNGGAARENAPGFPVAQGAPISPLDQMGKGGK